MNCKPIIKTRFRRVLILNMIIKSIVEKFYIVWGRGDMKLFLCQKLSFI